MNDIVSTEIVAYNEFRAQLAELREFNDKAVFNYEDPKGNKEARSHIFKLRKTKTAVDKCRKEEKKASLEYGRKVDSEAKDIFGEIEEMISVHQAPIDEIERKEKERVNNILSQIEKIRFTPEVINNDTDSETLSRMIEWVNSQEITQGKYQEFTEQAAGVKTLTLDNLRKTLADRQKYEAEKAELQKLREEATAREKKERDDRIAKEAADRAKKKAEDKAERARVAAEKREQALKDAQERAELEKREAEQRAIQAEKDAKEAAARAAKETEARVKREAAEKKRMEKEKQAKREANKKHAAKINGNAKRAFLTVDGISEVQAQDIVILIAQGKVPNVSITY